jgi:UDP-N-acetylglucosamine 2-epimerase (non-hydrolysing)
MRNCVFIVGTRAQLVKVSPVLRLAVTSGLPHTVWFTGQHEESIDDLISDFQLTSKFVMPGRRHERSSVGKLLTWLPIAFRDCRRFVRSVARSQNLSPLVVVHGDTLSTLVGALAAKSTGAEVVHMESGLSSLRLLDPFPEEILRRLTFKLTRYALCPNADASARMRRRGQCVVVDTGDNTMLDCVRHAVAKSKLPVWHEAEPYFVTSIHRFENIYRKSYLKRIVDDVVAVSAYGKVHFVLHPSTERRLRKSGFLELLRASPGVTLEPRMPFTRFLALIAGARGVLSDGGSNQEELSYLGVPTVLFRERSERPNGLGANIVFRREVPHSLAHFVESGNLDKLRQASCLSNDVQPSQTTILSLHQWSRHVAKK